MKYKRVTEKRLRAMRACVDGRDYVVNNCPYTDSAKVVEWLIKEDKLDWANWLIVMVMERKQYLAYAIYSAEQVIDIYENKYPDDDRPRKAVEATRQVLKRDTKKNKAAAAAAAAAAAYAVDAADAAYYAVDAAAATAAAAYYAADADDAADAAYAAAYAAAYTCADYAERRKMRLKILKYGIKLLKS